MNDREYQAIDFPGLYCGRVLFGPVVYPETRKLVSHYDAKFEHQSHRGFGSYLVTGFQRLHPGQTTKITKADYDSFVATLAFGRAAHGKRRLCGFISTLPNAAPHFVCAALQRKEIALSDIWKGRFNPFDKVSPKHPLFPQRLEAVLKQMIAALQEVRTMQKDSLPTKWLSIPKEQQVVVHGDLKPTNMLWKVKEQVIAIADWDSAKLIPAAGVDVPPTGFTAEFLSPEGEHYTTPGQDMFAIVMSALAVASGRFTEAVDPKFFVEVYIACPRLRALFDRTVAPGHHLLGRPDPTEALNLIPMSVEESEGIVRVLMEASMEFDAPVFSRVPPPRRLLSELDSSLIEQALHPVNQAYCAQFGAAMLNLKTEMQIGLQHGSDLESQVVNQPPPRELESTNDGVFRIQGSANGWPGDESLQSHSHQPTPSFANSTLEHVTTDESIRKKRERPEGGPDMDDMEAVKLPLPLAKRSKNDAPVTAPIHSVPTMSMAIAASAPETISTTPDNAVHSAEKRQHVKACLLQLGDKLERLETLLWERICCEFCKNFHKSSTSLSVKFKSFQHKFDWYLKSQSPSLSTHGLSDKKKTRSFLLNAIDRFMELCQPRADSAVFENDAVEAIQRLDLSRAPNGGIEISESLTKDEVDDSDM
eukprot:TRINITY_DN609_c0_g1_i1.p1 TRINITY_DN609_c0_g1~~TRINITY_DN609_c0_g1_i1.p1  ORF type:complete len:647 (+),score=109.37 TRINITY_DN609_c0_g1_i1:230-2170(+)